MNFNIFISAWQLHTQKKMQGDQPLMAAIITMQALLSFIMLLLTLLLGRVAFCMN